MSRAASPPLSRWEKTFRRNNSHKNHLTTTTSHSAYIFFLFLSLYGTSRKFGGIKYGRIRYKRCGFLVWENFETPANAYYAFFGKEKGLRGPFSSFFP